MENDTGGELCYSCLLSLALASATPAFAEELPEAPWWHVNVGSRPTYLAPGGEGTVVVSATNLGDGEVEWRGGAPVILTDKLPKGVDGDGNGLFRAGLRGTSVKESCSGSSEVVCTVEGVLPPYQRLEAKIKVRSGAGTGGLSRQGVRWGERLWRWRGGGICQRSLDDQWFGGAVWCGNLRIDPRKCQRVDRHAGGVPSVPVDDHARAEHGRGRTGPEFQVGEWCSPRCRRICISRCHRV